MTKLFILAAFVCFEIVVASSGELRVNDRKVTYGEWSPDVEVQVPGLGTNVFLQTRTTQLTIDDDRRFPIHREIRFAHLPNSRIGWLGDQADKLVVVGNEIVSFSIHRSVLEIRTSFESPVTRSVEQLISMGIEAFAGSFENPRGVPDLAIYLPLIFGLFSLEDTNDSRPHSFPSASIDDIRVLENSISLTLNARLGHRLVLELDDSFKPIAAAMDGEAVPILDYGFIKARKTPPRVRQAWGTLVRGTIDSPDGPVIAYKRWFSFGKRNVHGTEEEFRAEFIFVPANGAVWIGRQPQRAIFFNGRVIGIETTVSKLLVVSQSSEHLTNDENLPDVVQERLNLFAACVQNNDFGKMEVIDLTKVFGEGEFSAIPTVKEILFEDDNVSLVFSSDNQRDLRIILDSEMVPRRAIIDGAVKKL